MIPPTITPPERTALRATLARVEPEPFDPGKHTTVLQAVAYRGLGCERGRIVRRSLDLGDIRENLKRAACRVYGRALSVSDVVRLDGLLRGAEGHRRRMGATARGSAPQRVCRPVPPPEVPMRRSTDTLTLPMFDEVVRRFEAAPPLVVPPAPPAPAPPQPGAVRPPSHFRERVEARRRELAAGVQPRWLQESPASSPPPSSSASEKADNATPPPPDPPSRSP